MMDYESFERAWLPSLMPASLASGTKRSCLIRRSRTIDFVPHLSVCQKEEIRLASRLT